VINEPIRGHEANRGGYKDIEKTEELIETPLEEEGKKKETPPEKKVDFDSLPDEIKRFIDQERTKASNTAREKAKREALKDPDIIKAITAQVEEEAKMTAEEKASKILKEAILRENKLDAREKLVKAGIMGDDHLPKLLDLVVTEDKTATLERTDVIVNLYTALVESGIEAKTREQLKNQPKPKTPDTVTKEFKDMSYNERLALKEKDPARYKAEMAKTGKTI